MQAFPKVRNLVKILKISKHLKIEKIVEEGAPALRVIRAGTKLTVHCSLPYRTAVNWSDHGPAKIRTFGRHFHVFSDLIYQELLVCYIQIFYMIMKFSFL